MIASLIFRKIDCSEPVYTSFTYCCVIVDPPCTYEPWVTSAHAARTMATGLTAPWW